MLQQCKEKIVKGLRYLRYFFRLIFHYVTLAYQHTFIPKLALYLKFLFHRYSPDHFNAAHVKSNIKTILRREPQDGLDSTFAGLLYLRKSTFEKLLFRIKNVLFLGAYQARVEKVVYFSLLTLTIEIYNPFTKKVLMEYLQRKKVFIEHMLEKIKEVNGKPFDILPLKYHLQMFIESSLLQYRIIQQMHRAVARQKEPEVVREAKKALEKGLFPLLVIQGCSGSYWMRNTQREIIGLFKPFDEEIHAPNNPVGPLLQSALGQRKTRHGVRVGEAAHREVAAFLVDQFFGFGIVPRTYYASFTHHVFYLATQNRISETQRVQKTKYGSFQEYIEGFDPLDKIVREDWKHIPLGEYQLLMVLDVILGNSDRNTGNILVAGDKIAAIDHGLTLPDLPETISSWYWWYLDQGKEPLYPSFIDLFDHFPYEELGRKLHKRCCIPWAAIDRMKERIVLFKEALKAGLVPYQMKNLMRWVKLYDLIYLDKTLEEKAREMIKSYDPEAEEDEES